jgi:hypothetical protein
MFLCYRGQDGWLIRYQSFNVRSNTTRISLQQCFYPLVYIHNLSFISLFVLQTCSGSVSRAGAEPLHWPPCQVCRGDEFICPRVSYTPLLFFMESIAAVGMPILPVSISTLSSLMDCTVCSPESVICLLSKHLVTWWLNHIYRSISSYTVIFFWFDDLVALKVIFASIK